MKVQKLQNEIKGNGFIYRLVKSSDVGFVFSVNDDKTNQLYSYEVFKRKLTPLCVDFEKKIFSETEFKERYPKNNDFGMWAWSPRSLKRAEEILASFDSAAENEPENQTNSIATLSF